MDQIPPIKIYLSLKLSWYGDVATLFVIEQSNLLTNGLQVKIAKHPRTHEELFNMASQQLKTSLSQLRL